MQVTFYQFTKRRNSTARPSTGGITVNFSYKIPSTVQGFGLKEAMDIHNPVIEVATTGNIETYCYATIGSVYYFVDMVRHISNQTLEFTLKIDTLATYKPQIQNTTAFVEYSTQRYQPYLIDRRLSTIGNISKVHTDSYSLNFDNQGCFLIGVIGGGSYSNYLNGGMLSVYACSAATARGIAQLVVFEQDWWEEVRQAFTNVKDAVTFMRWIPLSMLTIAQIGTWQQIYIGNYQSDLNGYALAQNATIQGSTGFPIPWQYNDFRNRDPYTSAILWLPFVGDFAINIDDLVQQERININYSISLPTGDLVYTIRTTGDQILAMASAICAIDYPLANASQDAKGQVYSIVGGATSALTLIAGVGNPAVGLAGFAGSAINGLIAGNTRNQSIKSAGSNGMALANISLGVTMYLFTQNTVQDPNEYLNTIGRPCNESVSLGVFSGGYVQCKGASVAINGYDREREEINEYLNSGFFMD